MGSASRSGHGWAIGLRGAICAVLCACAPVAASDAQPPAGEGPAFRKVDTRHFQLPRPLETGSPGLLDPAHRVELTFPENGDRINLPLPPRDDRMLTAAIQNGELWVDLDGDASKGKNETYSRGPAGYGPVRCEFAFPDGTKTPYEFVVLPVGETKRWRLLRACAKTAKIEGADFTLLDDNNNGRFDDYGADSMLVAGQPPCFLSRMVHIRGKLHELTAHPAGNTIECRPYEGPTEFVDMLQNYKPPQKGAAMQFAVVGTERFFFSFDERAPRLALPEGSYSWRLGLLVRNREEVLVLRGEMPSFTVKKGTLSAPAWGGRCKLAFDMEQDGHKVSVKNVRFAGEAGELYKSLSLATIRMTGYLGRIGKDTRTNLEYRTPQGMKRFEVGPDGELLPLEFEPPVSEELQVTVEYVSGVLSRLMHEERLTFVKARRPKPDAPGQ